MAMLRPWKALVLVAALAPLAPLGKGNAGTLPPERGRRPVAMPSSVTGSVSVFGATWCSACKILEAGLREKNVPFDVIDVDQSPNAYAKARAATNTSAIPVTSVVRGDAVAWVVGADVQAVERAYRGE